jgi:hypothetical protein
MEYRPYITDGVSYLQAFFLNLFFTSTCNSCFAFFFTSFRILFLLSSGHFGGRFHVETLLDHAVHKVSLYLLNRFTLTTTHSPTTFQRLSAGFSLCCSDNFGNFLRRLAFALRSLLSSMLVLFPCIHPEAKNSKN